MKDDAIKNVFKEIIKDVVRDVFLAGDVSTGKVALSKIEKRDHAFEVGRKYFIMSVTHHYIGKVIEVCNMCVVLQGVAWVADDGRFHKAMKGEWSSEAEHEPFPPETKVQVFYSAMLDASEWMYDLIVKPK